MSRVLKPTQDGNPVTSPDAAFQKESEKIKDALAMLKDVTNLWPCRMMDGNMPKPHISSEYGMVIVLPLGRHVIKNAVTSDGKMDFEVDGERIVPVTSDKE